MTVMHADVVGEQLELDVRPLVIPPRVKGATLQERFESFHALNPWVLTALETLTDAYLQNRDRIGIKMLIEQLRWHHDRSTRGDAFKFNNNLASRYVRLLVERNPAWASAFERRRLLAD